MSQIETVGDLLHYGSILVLVASPRQMQGWFEYTSATNYPLDQRLQLMIIFNIVTGILTGDAPAAAPGHSGDSQIGKLDERTSPGQSFH